MERTAKVVIAIVAFFIVACVVTAILAAASAIRS